MENTYAAFSDLIPNAQEPWVSQNYFLFLELFFTFILILETFQSKNFLLEVLRQGGIITG